MSTAAAEAGPLAAPDVSVVVVSYNTRALLDACLRSVLASRGVGLEVFVVDNASPDGSADHVAAAFPGVTLVRNPVNRGFAAANNAAIRRAAGRHVLLLNPDTVVRPDTIARLSAFLDERPAIAITGPRVLNPDGTLQSCGYAFPTLAREIAGSRDGRRLSRRGRAEGAAASGADRRVDWVDGCCLLIRRRVIDRIGPLDERYFLYAEELDWCRTAARAGWAIETCDEAEMTHFGGQSTAQVRAASLAMLIETRLRYYRKHDGLGAALLVAAVYAAGCARRLFTEPEKSRAKLRGIGQWWASLRGDGRRARAQRTLDIPDAAAGRRGAD